MQAIRDLITALSQDASLRDEFQDSPVPVFMRFGIDQAMRALLRNGGPRLEAAIGADWVQRARDLSLVTTPSFGYPGFAQLQIASLTVTKPYAGVESEIRIRVTWDHVGLPQYGMPVWICVRVFNDQYGEVLPMDDLVVPTRIDFEKKEADVARTITFPREGKYSVTVDATTRETEESSPYLFVIGVEAAATVAQA